MQMVILPAHGRLNQVVHFRQGNFGGNFQTPPDYWLDVAQPKFHLINELRRRHAEAQFTASR